LLPLPAIVEEVTSFEPGRRLAYRAIAGVPLANYHCDVLLTPRNGGTAISYTVAADQRLPLLEPVIVRIMATALLTALARAAAKAP
jgi:hypothetical protein